MVATMGSRIMLNLRGSLLSKMKSGETDTEPTKLVFIPLQRRVDSFAT